MLKIRPFNINKFQASEKLGLALILISVILIPYWFYNSKIIELHGGCGNDGLTYCSMALGNIEFAPFSRRTLLPFIVNLLGFSDIVYTFYILNIIFILVSILYAFLLISKLNYKNRFIIVGLILLNPHITRWLFSYPVVTDYLGLMLAIMFFYYFLALKSNTQKILLLGVILILLSFVRENIPLTIILGLIIWSIYSRKDYLVTIILSLVSIISTLISFNQPATLNTVQETSLTKLAKDQILFFTENLSNLLMLFYFIFFGLTFLALRALFILPSRGEKIGGLFISFLAMSISGPLFGGEARHFVIGGILLQIYFLIKVGNPKTIVFYLLPTIAFWNLWSTSNGSIESFMAVFGQRFAPLSVTYQLVLTGMLQWGLALVLFMFFQRNMRSSFRTQKH